MSLKWPPKDTNEVLDYTVDWSARLVTDTIATSTFTVPAGLNASFDTFDNTSATIWLTTGVDGITYNILNRITTAGGRTMDQTVQLKIKER